MAKKIKKTIIDTSFAKEFQERLKKEELKRIKSLADAFNKSNQVTVGTRKGINSIMKKAGNRHKVAEEKARKVAEEKKAQKENKKYNPK